ncbi:MAG: hypothetical protein DRH97_03265 [Chloroflexi bacterium]|nr:MAG: hypothetical protein DRH97_03265 [Chloroflexota bacterium]
MISVEVALIMTVGGIAGSILVSQMLQMNWFKRENFKFSMAIDRKENSIRFRKMERDLGLSKGKPLTQTEARTPMDWLETIKKLDPNMLHNLVDSFSGQKTEYEEGDPESEGGLIEKALGFAKSNPELAQNFIDGLNKGKGGQQVEEIIR